MTLRDWNRSARVDSTRPSYTPEDKAKLKAKQKQLCRFSSRSSFAPYNVAISRFAILFIGFALEWNRCQPPPHAIVVVPSRLIKPDRGSPSIVFRVALRVRRGECQTRCFQSRASQQAEKCCKLIAACHEYQARGRN
jgi:hypothetical protein